MNIKQDLYELLQHFEPCYYFFAFIYLYFAINFSTYLFVCVACTPKCTYEGQRTA